jgi:hypothetical protein
MYERRKVTSFGHSFPSEDSGYGSVRWKGFTSMSRSGRRPEPSCGGGMSFSKEASVYFCFSVSPPKLRPEFDADLSATRAARGVRDEANGHSERGDHTAGGSIDLSSSRGRELGEQRDASARAVATPRRSPREVRRAQPRLGPMVNPREVTSRRHGSSTEGSSVGRVRSKGFTSLDRRPGVRGRGRPTSSRAEAVASLHAPSNGAEIFTVRSHATSATAATQTA